MQTTDVDLSCQILPDVLGGRIETATPLRHNEGNAATGGIWRVRGPGGTAILKVAQPPSGTAGSSWPTSDEPTHYNYWRREVLAYTTGLAGRVYADAGIAVPEPLATGTRPGGAVELWLADVPGVPGTSWPVPRLGAFAHELGAAQARWAGRVPDLPWLSRRWLAQYLDHGPSRVVWIDRDEHWNHPLAEVWPAGVRQCLRQLWERRDRYRAAAEAQPRTLCHLDVWPTNLIDDAGTSVLLDWSFIGDGAIGEDAANLIVDSVTDGLIDAVLLPEITATVTDGYLAGLRDGGFTGSPDPVRRAIAICGAAKYCWFGPAVLSRVLRDGTFGHPQYGQDEGGQAAVDRLRGLVELLAAWAGDLP
ncbi:aminoglycoside phosphotransferase family protein [Rugosimonospora africana]|uniref:aminoglycoside phosphotransferase family protein n=1 Tax=Rugosimonospora africana TaxID=556532 RepID=UPI001942D3DF|nr:aminoglycoside phosphotransferase family protein [Rugosimonospora africana]